MAFRGDAVTGIFRVGKAGGSLVILKITRIMLAVICKIATFAAHLQPEGKIFLKIILLF
jgi:hypothetical protein